MIDIYENIDIFHKYLSSYSSNLNSIEEIFIQFKIWCKKYWIKINIMNLKKFLNYAMKNIKNEIKEYFCKYMIDDLKSIHEELNKNYWNN